MQVKKVIISIMKVMQNTDLRLYSTMRLGGRADFSAVISNKNDLVEAVNFAKDNKLEIVIIGKGSNVIWKDEGFSGLLLINEINWIEEETHPDGWLFTVGSGYNWNDLVMHTVKKGLTGIEALALIPGTVGATPIQNVGAYGQEVSNTIVNIEAYDLKEDKFVNISNQESEFDYRTSRFNTKDKKRFIICSVSFKLTSERPNVPLYPSVQNYFDDHKIIDINPENISSAVIEIRTSKLPNPNIVANNGSFFSNPIISQEHFINLQKQFEDIVYWQTENGQYKLSAAWLIDHAGFTNYYDKETGMATWPKQSLVLINKHAKTTADLLKFKDKITKKVHEFFKINLEQEPELLP